MHRHLYADPTGKYVHQVVLGACQQAAEHTVLIDTSVTPFRRFTGAEYATLVEQAARGFVQQGLQPGEVVGIFLCNSWEYAVANHAATLAGGIVTPMNPS